MEAIKQRAKNIWNFFTTYEKIWFFGILILAFIFAFVFPEEEEINGVNGSIIMTLYLLDIFLNILCELLLSKQSKWNFIVSVFIEITEIVTLVLLATRFSSMAVTIFFWLPIDIISFINWHMHPDRQKTELTKVRSLSTKAQLLVVFGIVVWTVVVGYIMTELDIKTEFFNGNRSVEIIVNYLDACVSAVGMANGLFILFRFREQWIAWYLYAIIEIVIYIFSQQYIFLILSAGYLMNSVYGYVKWTKYIKSAKENTDIGKSVL